MSHYSTSPRKNYIVVHHDGGCGSENFTACQACYNPPAYFYDFCIDRVGNICDNGTWTQSCGGHAFQANCASIGVKMQGCYGGCGGCDLAGFNDPQLCGLAFLSLHLLVPSPNTFNHISHNKSQSWKPCACHSCSESGCAGPTACCGTNLQTPATGDGWTTEGFNEMQRMLWMRNNLANGFNCLGTCPC
jgi:hypothetical protein